MWKRLLAFGLVLVLTLTVLPVLQMEQIGVAQAAMNDDKVNCVAYIQTDEPWASAVYGTASVGLTGCGILSACNALNYMYDVFNTPEKANAFIREWGAYANSIEGFNPTSAPRSGCYRYVLYGTEISSTTPFIDKYGEKYGIKMTTTWVENWNYANVYAGASYNNIYVNQQTDLKNNLARGSTAICIVPGHFIVLAAYNPANDHFLVLDSAPSADRKTGNGVAWISANDLSGGIPALTVGGYCVISTTKRRNPSPMVVDDTTTMIYDGESFPTMRTAFSTSLMFSKNHTEGLRSLKMLYANPTAATNKVGGFTYITLDGTHDFSSYDTFTFDLYLEKALPGSHRFQVNFCATGEDGYNAMVTLNDLKAGWHTFSINRESVGKAVDSADWTKVKYIRLVWWNYAQVAGATYFCIDNFKGVNTDLVNAREVMTAITALPQTVTLENGSAITAARTAYNALTARGKAYVTNLVALETAEAVYQGLVADQQAVENVNALIDAIPTPVHYGVKDEVYEAKAAYDLLRSDLQAQISSDRVEKLNGAYQSVRAMEQDAAAASLVQAQIDALPQTVTLADEQALLLVKQAYDGLTPSQQGYVTNYETLETALAALAALKEQDQKDRADAASVDAMILALPATVTLADEQVITVAANAYNGLNGNARSYVEHLDTLLATVDTWNALKEQDDNDRADAVAVDALILELPAVEKLTLDHQTQVQQALAAYNALNHTAKGYVTAYDTLQAVLEKMVDLAFIYGDVNHDGEVNNKDYGALQRYLNGWDESIRLDAADVYYDGVVDNKDYAVLQRFLNGWDVTLGPGEEEPQAVLLDLDVMTFNLRQSGDQNADGTYSLDGTNAWHIRKNAVMNYLNNSGCDILCLQEIKRVQNAEMQPLFSEDYTALYYERDNSANPEGLTTVFNNKKFELVSQNMFWLSDTPEVMSKGWGVNYYRIATEITLKHKESGQLITVYNVQMDHQFETARQNGVNLILEKAQNAPGQVIFAGNFNVEADAGCYTLAANALQDTMVKVDPNKIMATYNAFGGDTEGFTAPCDFIFVNKECALVNSTRICNDKWTNSDGAWRYYSDFYAVRSNVTLLWNTDASQLPEEETVSYTVPVMSFNIRQSGDKNADGTYTLDGENGWHNRGAAVISYLNNSGMDILCLQEVKKCQSEDILAGLSSKYQGVYYARRSDNTNPEGLMVIFDKTKYDLVSHEMFWLSETPGKQSLGWGANYYRICVQVVLRHKQSGELLNVFNLHLDHQVEAARVNGLALVMEKVTAAAGHSIVAGDFNTEATSGCYEIIGNAMTDCQSVAQNVGITYQGWGKEDDGFTTPIDFIFTDKANTTVKSYKVCKDMWTDATGASRYYSDHYAISSLVELSH